MDFSKKLFACLSLATGLYLNGCTVSGADDEIILPNQATASSSSKDNHSIDDVEMDFTYRILSYYYVNANTELRQMGYYINAGEENGYSSETFEFPDVYYMYNQMSDDYTYYIGYYYLSIYGTPFTDEEMEGIGARLEEVEVDNVSKIVVSEVFKNSPADLGKLKRGDTILFIGKTAPGSIADFEKLANKSEGSTDSLTVKRGNDTLQVSITLFCYLEPTVSLSYKNDIPVISISEFLSESATKCSNKSGANKETGTAWEFEQALKNSTGATIVDLRGNGGGNIQECVNIAKMMLSEKDTIIVTNSTAYDSVSKGQIFVKSAEIAMEPGFAKDRYFVFMADTNTASCSEILLSAMAVNKKVPVVGLISYGKGIGQYYFDTPAEGFAITTSIQFFDKNMDSYHNKGIVPDYEIGDPEKALDKAVEIAKEGKAKRTQGYGEKSLGHFSSPAKRAFSKKEFLRKGAYEKKTLDFIKF